jgi:ATP-dependent RNA helicase DeaD
MTQDQRDRVMNNFRKRNFKILVATDVAARGLDVDDLTHVVNYDLPGDPDVYTHRSGRTGRAGKAGISRVLVHMRETYKLRAIERIMNKRFEHKKVPTGKQVCEARLMAMLGKIKQYDMTETAKLGPYLPKINEAIGDMSREELVRRFVLKEFGSFLDCYKDAPDLNVSVGQHGQGDDRHGHRDRNDRDGRQAFAGGNDGQMSRLRINVGRANGISVPNLISLINRATPGPMIKLGRINLFENSSVFEMAAGGEQMLMENIGRMKFKGLHLKCEADRGASQGAAPHERGPRHCEKHGQHPRPAGDRGRHSHSDHFRKKKHFHEQGRN